jgi:protein-tyrosine phosphatase
VLLKHRLAEKAGCSIDDLEARGIIVTSAGIAAMPGAPASTESVAVAADRQLNLSDHAAQPMTERLLRDADIIFTMTSGHRQALLSHWPAAAERTQLICQDGRDVGDPIGGTRGHYEHCANQIDAALADRVADMDLDILCPQAK